MSLVKKNLIHSAAHITGGGLVENLLRSVPNNLSLEIDLSKIKILKIFKWLKKNNISDNDMMGTFNCGIGFCIILPRHNIKKLENISQKIFTIRNCFISKKNRKIFFTQYFKNGKNKNFSFYFW